MMRTTFMANAQTVEHKWYVVDATGKALGRLSSEVATLLRGKHKPTFTPHVDCGDFVIVINADKIELTGDKWNKKLYIHHSMHPGGLKVRTAKVMNATQPEKMLELAIFGMLPKGSLGRQVGNKLFVYRGSEHPHAAQKPEVYELSE
ncbi:MAG: ribosomal protein [Haloplasmataceae bacterium]|jgi:large subunit ribosomal protein L13|nr:ribosomal protein [Haloplasmataceae bacterium]